jgi:hypothetical protein
VDARPLGSEQLNHAWTVYGPLALIGVRPRFASRTM